MESVGRGGDCADAGSAALHESPNLTTQARRGAVSGIAASTAAMDSLVGSS
jgi:hypothetical protein